MLKKRISLVVLAIAAASQAMASEQSESNGFMEDSHLDLFFRNGYINRDLKHGNQDKAEWGQAATATFSSGFTRGTIGVGFDVFGMYAVRLDGGKGKSGAAGIDFFKQGDSGEAANDLSRVGGAVKFRLSNTVLKYGDMMPSFPVLQYDNTRLLPETYTGTLITSREIEGLELNAGRFTSQVRKSAQGHDSGELKSINILGGSYQLTDDFSFALYASDVEDVLKQKYINLNWNIPFDARQSLTLDFNGYKTHYDRDYLDQDNRKNTIWSLQATYTYGAHSFILAHQRNSGDHGYDYGWYQSEGAVGNGGSTIYLANSFWSDFNAKDERSWQLGYGLDFSEYGVPGLTYRLAYVRGSNIDDGTHRGSGTEREWFNQVQYVVQSGPAKDLTLRLRSSILRVSNNANGYMDDGNEIRAFIEYPLNIF